MISQKHIVRDFRNSGALHAHIAPFAFIGNDRFLTKAGDIGMVLKVRGIDYECRDAGELDAITRRFESALKIFDERFVIYQCLIKRDNPDIPERRYAANAVLQHALTTRSEYLKAKARQLYEIDVYFAVVFKGWRCKTSIIQRLSRIITHPRAALEEALSNESKVIVLEKDVRKAGETIASRVESFSIQLSDMIEARILDKYGAYRFFRQILNYSRDRADSIALKYDTFIDYFAAGESLECHRDHLVIGDRYVKVLTLKDPPGRTSANLLRMLVELPANFIAVSEWTREENYAMRKRIQSARRHHHNSKIRITSYFNTSPNGQASASDLLKDDSREALVAELGACLTELEVNGNHFGRFSLTISLHSSDKAELERNVAQCFKAFSAHDAELQEERYNQLNAWLSIVPGNYRYNLRRLFLLNKNYADLSFLFTLATGDKENRHLGAEHLAVLETRQRTPYFLNLHHRDIAHSLITGSTGSGKSFLLNFLITHLQKYSPITFIFDLGGSYQHVTRIFDGAYLPVGIEKRSFSINPFSLPPAKENLQFLFSFVKVLAALGGYEMTIWDDRDLYDQIESLYLVDEENRRLFTLSNILNRNLRERLSRWVEGGQYATLFDNVEDNLTFQRFQCFDFSAMDRYPEVLEPLLFYILHRANARIQDPALSTTFKVFVIDEAWRFLGNRTIRQYIIEALKTWRKHNAAMILATQSRADLDGSGIEASLIESCPTQLFLANPGMDRQVYREVFHLNETETRLVADLTPKREILIKRPDMSKVLSLEVDKEGYWLYTNDPYDNDRRRRVFERFGFEKGLKVLAAKAPKTIMKEAM